MTLACCATARFTRHNNARHPKNVQHLMYLYEKNSQLYIQNIRQPVVSQKYNFQIRRAMVNYNLAYNEIVYDKIDYGVMGSYTLFPISPVRAVQA